MALQRLARLGIFCGPRGQHCQHNVATVTVAVTHRQLARGEGTHPELLPTELLCPEYTGPADRYASEAKLEPACHVIVLPQLPIYSAQAE